VKRRFRLRYDDADWPSIMFQASRGSYFNDPQIHVRDVLNGTEMAEDEWNTTGFRLVSNVLTTRCPPTRSRP